MLAQLVESYFEDIWSKWCEVGRRTLDLVLGKYEPEKSLCLSRCERKAGQGHLCGQGGMLEGPVQCETSVRSVGAVPCVEVGAAAACALSVGPSGGQD